MLINGSVEGEAGDMAFWVPCLNMNAVVSKAGWGASNSEQETLSYCELCTS